MDYLVLRFALPRILVALMGGTMKKTRSAVTHLKNVAVSTFGRVLPTQFANVPMVRVLDFMITDTILCIILLK